MYNPYQQQTNTYAFVNGIEGARNYQIMPNQNVLLMDNDSPMLYVKSANQMGQTSIKAFKLVEVQTNMNTTDALEKLEQRLKNLEEKVGGMNG